MFQLFQASAAILKAFLRRYHRRWRDGRKVAESCATTAPGWAWTVDVGVHSQRLNPWLIGTIHHFLMWYAVCHFSLPFFFHFSFIMYIQSSFSWASFGFLQTEKHYVNVKNLTKMIRHFFNTSNWTNKSYQLSTLFNREQLEWKEMTSPLNSCTSVGIRRS